MELDPDFVIAGLVLTGAWACGVMCGIGVFLVVGRFLRRGDQ
jgi:hypothetical protein